MKPFGTKLLGLAALMALVTVGACKKLPPEMIEEDCKAQIEAYFARLNAEAEDARLEWIKWKYKRPDRDQYGKQPQVAVSRYQPGDPPPPQIAYVYLYDRDATIFEGLVCPNKLDKFDQEERDIRSFTCGHNNLFYFVTKKPRCAKCGKDFDLKHVNPGEVSGLNFQVKSISKAIHKWDVQKQEEKILKITGTIRYVRQVMFLDEDPRIYQIRPNETAPFPNTLYEQKDSEVRYPAAVQRNANAWLEEFDFEYQGGNLKTMPKRAVMEVKYWVEDPEVRAKLDAQQKKQEVKNPQ